MKLITTFLLFFTLISFSQTDLQKATNYLNKKGEVFFEFVVNDKAALNKISKNLSIITFDAETNIVKANANQKEFDLFLTKNYSFTVKKSENEIGERAMFDRKNQNKIPFSYTSYPTYSEYLAIMEDFQVQYPTLCQKILIGTSVQNRELLAVKLSDNVTVHEQEPRFLYVSSMHGDEITGYVTMLRLIEYLLENYGTNTEVTNLLDNYEIYISPLHNPDGTYAGGNNTVSGATRRNANFADLNRNFPDILESLNPDGMANQPETLAYMAFAEANHIVLSCNFHGGIEVVNYPWDTFSERNADDDYWQFVSREYADQVHSIDPSYMTPFDNGVTNGWDWFEADGGRQDFMNYYLHSRELTIEISDQKTPPGSQLPYYWNTNKDALLNYIKQAGYGIRGLVTNAETGEPIHASVYISSLDHLNTWVETELPIGDYYRPIKGGTYQVTYAAPCFESQTVTVSVADLNSVTRNIALQPLAEQPVVSDVTIDSGQTANLATTTTGTINWYDSLTSTTVLGTGTSFTTPILTATTSYFAENTVLPNTIQLPAPSNTNNGSFFGGTQSLVFDCFEAIQLHTVTVNAENSGSFVMELQDNDGNVLQSGTFSVSSGVHEVVVDFDIPVGRDLKLLRTSGVQLFRNNGNVNYPYKVERFITIKRSTASGGDAFGFYYSFYNWKLQQALCVSDRSEVVVTVNNAVSVEDELLNTILIYPNPVKENLRLSLVNAVSNLSVSIYDILGKQVVQKNFTEAQDNLNINVSSLNTGVYFVKINIENSSIIKRIIVE